MRIDIPQQLLLWLVCLTLLAGSAWGQNQPATPPKTQPPSSQPSDKVVDPPQKPQPTQQPPVDSQKGTPNQITNENPEKKEIPAADKPLQSFERQISIWREKARIALRNRDRETAKELYQKILSVDPDHQETILLLAEILYDQGLRQQSQIYYQRLWMLQPEHALALVRLGQLSSDTDKKIFFYEKALAVLDLDENIFYENHRQWLHSTLARIYFAKRWPGYREGLSAIDISSLSTNPEQKQKEAELEKKIESHLYKIQEQVPAPAWSHAFLAYHFQKLGNVKDAIWHLERSFFPDLKPDQNFSLEQWKQLAPLYHKAQDEERALGAYTAIHTQDQGYHPALLFLYQYNLKEKKWEEVYRLWNLLFSASKVNGQELRKGIELARKIRKETDDKNPSYVIYHKWLLSLLQRQKEINPGKAGPILDLIDYYENPRLEKELLPLFQELLTMKGILAKDRDKAYEFIADYHRREGQRRLALEYLARLNSAYPDQFIYRRRYLDFFKEEVQTLLSQKEYSQAIRLIDQHLAYGSQDADLRKIRRELSLEPVRQTLEKREWIQCIEGLDRFKQEYALSDKELELEQRCHMLQRSQDFQKKRWPEVISRFHNLKKASFYQRYQQAHALQAQGMLFEAAETFTNLLQSLESQPKLPKEKKSAKPRQTKKGDPVDMLDLAQLPPEPEIKSEELYLVLIHLYFHQIRNKEELTYWLQRFTARYPEHRERKRMENILRSFFRN